MVSSLGFVYIVNPGSPDSGPEENINVNIYFHFSLWNLKKIS